LRRQPQQITDRLATIEQRLMLLQAPDVAEQQVLAARIANMQHLAWVRQIASIQVKTLAARDLPTAAIQV
jgi:hypothetical protein